MSGPYWRFCFDVFQRRLRVQLPKWIHKDEQWLCQHGNRPEQLWMQQSSMSRTSWRNFCCLLQREMHVHLRTWLCGIRQHLRAELSERPQQCEFRARSALPHFLPAKQFSICLCSVAVRGISAPRIRTAVRLASAGFVV